MDMEGEKGSEYNFKKRKEKLKKKSMQLYIVLSSQNADDRLTSYLYVVFKVGCCSTNIKISKYIFKFEFIYDVMSQSSKNTGD